MSLARWGIGLAEMRSERWPSAQHDFPVSEEIWYRAVSVDAPVEIVFRWICQLRAAPYSYDWIDNFGRQSPRSLTDGLQQLEKGQRVMAIFRVYDFSINNFITLDLWPPRSLLCSELRITYLCASVGKNHTRLMVRVDICYPRNPFRTILCPLLLLGDLLMMRKQLLTLKRLAEEASRRVGALT
jgi:hypothetical protein